VASCFTLALVHSAGKRGLAVRDVRVDVVGEYAGRRFDAVHIDVDVSGPTAEELDDLIAAAERVCYVTNTLRAAVAITVTAGPPTSAGS
jgi:organic hydroperoxide reductase OsmC/OhrA